MAAEIRNKIVKIQTYKTLPTDLAAARTSERSVVQTLYNLELALCSFRGETNYWNETIQSCTLETRGN